MDSSHEVFVLRGGFAQFQGKYKVSKTRGIVVTCVCNKTDAVVRMILLWWKIGTRISGLNGNGAERFKVNVIP